jgi:hypothetical protein
VPLTSLQSQALLVLAAQRSPDSYIAGGVAINRNGPRFSRDIDIFQDSVERLQTSLRAKRSNLPQIIEAVRHRSSWQSTRGIASLRSQ